MAALVATGASCNLFGPSESFEGEWKAPAGKYFTIGLSLKQSGDTITGVRDRAALQRRASDG